MARGKDDTIEQACKCTVHLAIRSEHLAHLIKLSRNAELFVLIAGKRRFWGLPVCFVTMDRRVAQRLSLAVQGGIEAEGTYHDVGVLLWKLQAWMCL